MSKHNVTEEVKAKIKDLQQKKTIELLELKDKIEETLRNEQEAAEAMKKATAVTDLKAYAIAKDKKAACITAAEMFEARYTQLQKRDFVTEEESDSVIKSMLDYEKELSSDYEKKVGAILQDLLKVTKEYKHEIADTEDTIRSWTSNIHPNYRSEYTTYADGTNRCDRPIPVHSRIYLGSDLSERVYHFLQGENLYPATKTLGGAVTRTPGGGSSL